MKRVSTASRSEGWQKSASCTLIQSQSISSVSRTSSCCMTVVWSNRERNRLSDAFLSGDLGRIDAFRDTTRESEIALTEN